MWLEDIKENFSNPILILLGNKIDIEKEKWQVTQEEINNLIKKTNIKYYAASAYTNEGINESFNYLANTIYNKIIIKKELNNKSLEENKSKKLKKKDEIFDYKTEYDKLKKIMII